MQAYLHIAIDGPAASGKSTLAKKLAQVLHINYCDTGAMYRACAFYLQQKGIVDISDEKRIDQELQNMVLELRLLDGRQEVFVNGVDVSDKLRSHAISKFVSNISTLASVRKKMVALQQELALKQDLILDGRDIGTHVLPNAAIKIYLIANVEERAKRRMKDEKVKGESSSFEEVKESILYRDFQDSHRALSPLVQAKDAILIDSSALTMEEVLQEVVIHVARWKKENNWPECSQKLGREDHSEDSREDKSMEMKKNVRKEEMKEERKAKAKKSRETLAPSPQMKGWRKLVILAIKFFMKIVYPYTLHHPEYAPQEGPALYIGNHVSAYDVACMIFPVKKNWVHFVAKKEVNSNFITRFFFEQWQTINVDTDKIDMVAVRNIMRHLKAGRILGIYPQSTRIKTRARLQMYPPRQGILFFAHKFNCPLYPVMIDGTFSPFKRTHIYFGKPFYIKASKKDLTEKGEYISFEIMQTLFSLANRDYYQEMDREDLRSEESFLTYNPLDLKPEEE